METEIGAAPSRGPSHSQPRGNTWRAQVRVPWCIDAYPLIFKHRHVPRDARWVLWSTKPSTGRHYWGCWEERGRASFLHRHGNTPQCAGFHGNSPTCTYSLRSSSSPSPPDPPNLPKLEGRLPRLQDLGHQPSVSVPSILSSLSLVSVPSGLSLSCCPKRLLCLNKSESN